MRILSVLLVFTAASASHAACETVADSSRVAVAGGSITEILFLLGQQQRIVATDTTSNFPPQAAEFPSVGYVRSLSVEGLLSLNPTLVLGEDDMGPLEVVGQLERIGVDVVRVPEHHTAAGVQAKVNCLASILGLTEQQWAQAQAQLQLKVEQLAQMIELSHRPRVAFLLNLADGVPMAAGANTSAHGLLSMVGASNAFAQIDGWKPVSLEAMVDADPDFLIMPNRGVAAAGGVDAVLNHPAIRLTNAGKGRQLIHLDGMAMLGFGPRTLDSALTIAQRLSAR